MPSVSGTIDRDTTWVASAGPYEVTGNLVVVRGVTLTVTPGVMVSCDLRVRIVVAGTLRAEGTAAQPITFTGTSAEPGWWQGLEIEGRSGALNSRSVLRNVTVEYAGHGQRPGLALTYATVTLTDAQVNGSGGDGITGYQQGLAHLVRCRFQGNAGYAVHFRDGSVNPTLDAVTATGNREDVVARGRGTLTGTHDWPDLGLPYVQTDTLHVAAGATWTLAAGVRLHLAEHVRVVVSGTLRAEGRPDAPISFTGSVPEVGWWDGLEIEGRSGGINDRSVLRHVTMEHAGYGQRPALGLTHATVALSDCTIASCGGDGITGHQEGTAHLVRCRFENNAGYAVQFEDGSVSPTLEHVTATGNGVDGIGRGRGTLTGTHRWPALGLDYVQTDSLVVAAGATWILDPGVRLRLAQHVRLVVSGTLRAQGTETAPVTLTGTVGEVGWWDGLDIEGRSGGVNRSVLGHVTLAHAGYGEHPAIGLTQTAARLTDCTVASCGGDGVTGHRGGGADLVRCHFQDNAGYAVHFEDGSVDSVLDAVTATGNGEDAVARGRGILTGTHHWRALGLPYVQTDSLVVAANATLTVDPGVQVRLAQHVRLVVSGTLRAEGTRTQPITLTGTSPEAGWWDGVRVEGSSRAAAYLTATWWELRHAGYDTHAAVHVSFGQAHLRHLRISEIGGDGLVASSHGASGSFIEGSHLVSPGHGARNDDGEPHAVLEASNNWWGHPTGPTPDRRECNPAGQGSRITTRVAFRPFLATTENGPERLRERESLILSLSPRRWFVPADGLSRVWCDLWVRDGAGAPVAGRTVRLISSHGRVTDGGVSDAQGHTLAYVVSPSAGEADLVATLDTTAVCEFGRSPSATVTFTQPSGAGGDAPPAPYLDDGIEILPLPIVRGVPTQVRGRLRNPGTAERGVDVSFGVAQPGIGLAFGPIGEIRNLRLPAGGSAVAEVEWRPPITGHFCIEMTYASTGDVGPPPTTPAFLYQPRATRDVQARALAGSGLGGRRQLNISVHPGPLASRGEKDKLRQMQSLSKKVTGVAFVGVKGGDGVVQGGAAKWIGLGGPKNLFNYNLDFIYDNGMKISESLGGDPPRQDFDVLATVPVVDVPVLEPDAELSSALADAFNELIRTARDYVGPMRAAAVSLDRYAGASAANRLDWASRQAAALLAFKAQAAAAMPRAADAIQAVLDVVHAEGLHDSTVSEQDARTYRDRMAEQGFDPEERAAAAAIGLTDDEIEAIRLERATVEPGAGSLEANLLLLRRTLIELSGAMAAESSPPPDPPVEAATAAGLTRLYTSLSEIPVGNPTDRRLTVDLRVRRIELPPDWIAAVQPSRLELDPGETETVTLQVEAGLPTVRGTTSRVAVEGWAEQALISGVVVDVVVPRRDG